MPACTSPLAVTGKLPRGTQARVLVRVACNSNVYWTLNVPVEIHRTDGRAGDAARRGPRRKHRASADVLVQSRVLPGLTSPYLSRPADLAGRLTRRPIPEGTAVTADALDAALLIHRGQNVILAARAGGFEVRAPGLAMADAAAEQRVRVRNLNSLKIVEGVADTAGCGSGKSVNRRRKRQFFVGRPKVSKSGAVKRLVDTPWRMGDGEQNQWN